MRPDRYVRRVRPGNGPQRPEPPVLAPEPPRHEVEALEGHPGVWVCRLGYRYLCDFATADLSKVAGHVVANQYDVR